MPLPSVARVILTDNIGNIQKQCYLEPTQKFEDTRKMQFFSETGFLHKYQDMMGAWWKEEIPEKVNACEEFLENWKWGA